MLSPRVTMMKKRLLTTKPSLSAERMVLVTEAYQKYAGEAVPIFRAKVFSYILDHMSIMIGDGELVVGSQNNRFRCASVFPEYTGSWLKEQLSILPTRPNDPLDVSEEDAATILKYLDWWEGKSLEEQAENFLPEDVQTARKAGIITIGSRTLATGHTTPDYNFLFERGFAGFKKECQEKIDALYGGTPEKQEKIDFWNACIIVSDAVIRFANRYADLAAQLAQTETDEVRKKELLKIASTCRRVPENSPTDFAEALQFVWFIQLLFHLESNSSANCFGRFDQYMLPYYKKGIEDGSLTDEMVLEMLESFYIKATEIIMLRPTDYSKDFAGYPMWQILMLGGVDKEGRDASNELSYLCLDAAAALQIAQPAVALRVHEGTPKDLYDKAAQMIQKGMANPAFFNDKCAIQTVLNKGGTLEEARDWVIIGCIEPHQGGGGTDASPSAGYLNLPKCLELVLHNGVDPLTGQQLGPKTGDPTSFHNRTELMDAVLTQMDYFWTLIQKGFNKVIPYHATRLPAIFASMVVDGCIDKGLPIQKGGARHTYSGIFPTGPASLADAIAAIDKFVFEEKKLTMEELICALDNNFEENEPLRLMLLNRSPKYGNDDPYVDSICDELIDHSADFVQQMKDSRGGTFCLCNQAQTVNVTMGGKIGATADGRFAFQPLSDNSAPAMGRDVCGPTCTINSVGKNMHQTNVWDGTLFNLRFDPKGVAGKKGINIIESVIDEYFEHDGLHIQINVVDDKTLRAAQKDPENYRNVIVRVAGYMAYFTELDKKVQDTIIERTAHLAS